MICLHAPGSEPWPFNQQSGASGHLLEALCASVSSPVQKGQGLVLLLLVLLFIDTWFLLAELIKQQASISGKWQTVTFILMVLIGLRRLDLDSEASS